MTTPRTPAVSRRTAFVRGLQLDGWDEGSMWGYDADLECYWALLVPAEGSEGRQGRPARIGPEHLLGTLDGLARVLGAVGRVPQVQAYLALTA